jgi:hypothetical protein
MLGGTVETYSCGVCGQIQARCAVGRERTWIRDYGPLWRSKLIDLWADEPLGLRSISNVLRVSCDTTRKAAFKLGLPLSRKGHKTLSVQSYPHLIIPKTERRRRKIDRLRREWLDNKERYPKLGMRGLREINPAVYATLYRYDREWLRANQPPRKVRALVVDWDERDRNLCRKLESAACDRTAVTQYKLTRSAGINGWVSDRLAKLPRARQTLQRLLGSDRTKAPPIAIVDGTHQE